jgi:hypothetical protein
MSSNGDKLTPEERESSMSQLKLIEKELKKEKNPHQKKLHEEYKVFLKKQLGLTGGRKSRKRRFFSK